MTFIGAFAYKENDLYHFLNGSLQGQIVLGKYMYEERLDYPKLKDLIILNTIKQDAQNFS